MPCLGLADGLEGLCVVGAHGNLSDIDVAVGGGNHAEVLLADALALSSELSDGAERRCLGSLTAGVGIDLGVKYEDVDIFARSDDVVETAVADVVGGTVAADDPLTALGQMSLAFKEFALQRASAAGADGTACSLGILGFLQLLSSHFGTIELNALTLPELDGSIDGQNGLLESCHKFIGGLAVSGRVFVGVEPFLSGLAHPVESGGLDQFLGLLAQDATHLLVAKLHTKTELAEVLEQGVVEAGTLALLVLRIRCGGNGSGVDGGAARSVGHHLTVTEELADELDVRRLAATGAGTAVRAGCS